MVYTIEDTLEEMALEHKRNFAPQYVSQRSGCNDLTIVTRCLLDLVGKKLSVYYEIECPYGDSDFAINSLANLPLETRSCHICGQEYTPNLDRVWIGFNFLPEYISHVKKKRSCIKEPFLDSKSLTTLCH